MTPASAAPPPGELYYRGRAWSAQAYVPVAGTTWTALISGTAGGEDAELISRLVRRMAGSISVDRARRKQDKLSASRHVRRHWTDGCG